MCDPKLMKTDRHLLLILLIYCLISCCLSVPLGFVDEGVTKYPAGISAVMVPNPRPGANGKPMLLLVKKEGRVDVMEDPDNSAAWTNILDISTNVCTNGPRGIQTIVAHPDFLLNPYIYIYYTRYTKDCPANAITGPSNRLSRFSLSTTTLTIQLSSELVLFESPPSVNLLHDGGGLVIGNDMKIYLATGDGGQFEYPQDLRNCWGKMIRLNLDGTVPVDNPFAVQGTGKGVPCRNNRGVPLTTAPPDAVCEEIYSYGFRNPFRMDLDVRATNEVRFSISDVGGRLWEEISFGGSKYKGMNYGWPDIEGPCTRDTLNDCPIPTGNAIDPHYYYIHNKTSGAAVTGAVYVPDNLWPSEFAFLHVDFSEGVIYNLIDDKKNQCRTCLPPRPGYKRVAFHEYPKIVDIFFASYKDTTALYYLTRYGEETTVRRIYFTGSTNHVPTAIISGLKPMYSVGDSVSFVGSQSSDQDGDALTYLWDFGDGRTSTQINPKIKFLFRRSYIITLKVTDALKQSSTDTTTIVVGERPTAKMELPIGGTDFKVGDVIRLKGSAFDTALNRSIVDPSQYFWEVRQHHETHFHPFLDLQSGNDFVISPAPIPEDFYAASNSYLQVIMTVYDSDGISKTVSRYLYPKKVKINFNSEPSGLEILLEGISFTTPITLTTWQNQRFTMNANDQGANKFTSWSTGTNRETSYLVPNSILTTTITAYFRQSLRPTKTPVIATPSTTGTPITAPSSTKIPTAQSDQSFAPINASSGMPTEVVTDRNWFKLFWYNIKSAFSHLWMFNILSNS
jgi:glucose/arabinose dehydrogenase